MPILLSEDGYEFRFFSSDGGEPPHVHVRGNGGIAKVWLEPDVRIAEYRRYNRHRRDEIIRKTERHRVDWIVRWRRHFGR